MNPTVSIVIPLYNKEKWIERTLSSLLNQTFTDWEAIIVDDGSSDRSVEVVESFIRTNPGNWILLKNQNAGQCPTRNAGILKAKGEFLAFLDADDIWSKNKLSEQVRILRENEDVSLVVSPYLIFSDMDKSAGHRLVVHKDAKKLLFRWLTLKGYGAGTESTGMTRTKLLERIGGFDETLSTSAGLYLTIQLAKLGRIAFSNNCLMAYRIHTGQWHSNTEILSRDMTALSTRPIEIYGKTPKSLNYWRDGYIRIAETRQKGRLISTLFAGNIFSMAFVVRIALVANIVSRNFMARARGKFARGICHFSREEFREFTSSF